MKMEKEEESQDMDNLASKLLKSRTVVISQQVDSKLTSKLLSQLVLLEQEGNDLPITVFINSPGGEIFSGFAIFEKGLCDRRASAWLPGHALCVFL